jgi:hypothetical protein
VRIGPTAWPFTGFIQTNKQLDKYILDFNNIFAKTLELLAQNRYCFKKNWIITLFIKKNFLIVIRATRCVCEKVAQKVAKPKFCHIKARTKKMAA